MRILEYTNENKTRNNEAHFIHSTEPVMKFQNFNSENDVEKASNFSKIILGEIVSQAGWKLHNYNLHKFE